MDQVFLPTAFFKGNFVPFNEANLSIATHALHYGTSAFGGMRGIFDSNNAKKVLLFRLKKHCKRFSNSAKFLQYDLPPEFVEEKILQFVRLNKPVKPFYIRPLVYVSSLGIAPRLHNIEKDFLIYGIEMGDYLSPEGIKVCFSSWFRFSDNAIPTRGKIGGSYVNSALAKTEAINRGFDEALMLDNFGNVTEASAMNIFMVRDEKLITPPINQDILEGITRASVIEIAKDIGIEVVERNISKTELIIADEVFLTGTAAKITPINQIENYSLPKNRSVTDKLKDLLSAISQNLDEDYRDWITEVEL